jgi:hypothetical protein
MLIVNDVVKDYDAVMTSVDHLKTIWPSSDWPEGLTFEGSHRPWLASEGVSDTTIVRVHRRHPIRVMVTAASISIRHRSVAMMRLYISGRVKVSSQEAMRIAYTLQ